MLEGERPMEFFRNLFGTEPVTFDFKWLRGVHKDAFTGAHVDNVYMGRGTSDLLTMWTPMGDVTVDMGTLAVVEGSNNDKKFQKLQVIYPNRNIVLDLLLSWPEESLIFPLFS